MKREMGRYNLCWFANGAIDESFERVGSARAANP